jgi:ABC-type multidrug transport system fused ATPase/permease subunit
MINLVRDIWSVLTPRQRRWVLAAQLLSILMAFSTVAGIASIAPFFSVLGNPHLIEQSTWLYSLFHQFGFSDSRRFTIALGLAFIAIVVVANLINVIGSFVVIRLALWIGTDLQSVLFDEYLHRPYAFYARTPTAVLYNNVIHETTRATMQILQNAFMLVTSAITALFIIVSLLVLNPFVALVMVAAVAGGYGLIYLALRNRLLRAGQAQSRLFTELTRIVNESLGAIKEIAVLRKQDFFHASFVRSSHALARAAAHTQLVGTSPRYVMECVAVVGLVAAALLAGAGDGGVGSKLGPLTFVGFAAYRLLPTLQLAFFSLVRIRADRPGFNSIKPDLLLARWRRHAANEVDPAWRTLPCTDIRLEDVSFRYEADRSMAVSAVTLRIPARAVVGIVGANGSGKTTLVDLIAGLLVPTTGRVEVDGIALNDANRVAWQSRIAYVPQNIFLLDTTVAANIALGTRSSEVDLERLRTASRAAMLDEFVNSLPDGYEHGVGERGVRLSGGQRQRIGIARALYAEASVLILDEATNALDGLTEHELMETVMRLRGRYTIIVIAHRLSTVRPCDVIFELERGRVAGNGTYDALLGSSESFRRLASVP